MGEHALAPALRVVPHDDPDISYSAQVGASMADVCYQIPSRCPGVWWFDARNSSTDVGSTTVQGSHTTAGPMASLGARISDTEHLSVIGSADFNGSTIISLECTTTNADFNQTRSDSIAKQDGRAFAEGELFRLRDLHKDRIYDVSLAFAGAAQVHIVAFEIDLDGRVLSSGNMLKPQQYIGGGGGGSNMNMDAPSTSSLSQSPHTTRVSSFSTPEASRTSTPHPSATANRSIPSPSSASAAARGPVVAGAAVIAMVLSFLIMALALYLRRRYARSRISAGILPYNLGFPDGGARSRLIKKRRILAFSKLEPSGDGLVSRAWETTAGPLPAVEGDTFRSGSDTVIGESLRGSRVSAEDVSDEIVRTK